MTDKVVVTLRASLEIKEISAYSLPLMQEYARCCGAEMVVLTPSRFSEMLNAYYEKMQLADLLEKYERVLFLDADILVSPDSPNLFDRVPVSRFGMVSVEPVFQRLERSHQLTSSLMGAVEWRAPYFNAGVMLASRAHRALFEADIATLRHWHEGAEAAGEGHFHDQDFFNHRLNQLGLPFEELGKSFNFTRAWGGFHRRFRKNFIHYAGLRGARAPIMARDAAILDSPWAHRLAASFPGGVWVWDRLLR